MSLFVAPASALADELRIHMLPYVYQDAFVLEVRDANGVHFALVDVGEDSDLPDGSDPRYPVRSGTSAASLGTEQNTISYLKAIGVTSDNLEFLFGTHAHSDHIGAADEVIYAFHPKRVYTPEYKDSFITGGEGNLWDNQYVYDHLVAAAKETGAALITEISESAPVVPSEGTTVASPYFSLGSAEIEIVNWNTDYKTAGYIDFNAACWGLFIRFNGRTILMMADMEDLGTNYTALAKKTGKVDILKISHHGNPFNNPLSFLQTIAPSYVLQTGKFSILNKNTVLFFDEINSHLYPTSEVRSQGLAALVLTIASDGNITSNYAETVTFRMFSDGYLRAFKDGAPINYTGTVQYDGKDYVFSNTHKNKAADGGWIKSKGLWYFKNKDNSWAKGWLKDKNTWYYLRKSDGAMVTGWQKIDGKWYYFYNSGAMATGWIKVKGSWYWLASSGRMATGWIKLNGTSYYLKSSGAMATGWLKLDGKWYYFYSSGAMATGWVKVKGIWYWLESNGAMATGWKNIKGHKYYLKSSGAMATGWLKLDGKWYYFYNSGAMATGWVKVRGAWYYLDKKTGVMLANQRTPDGYYVNGSGAWVKSKGKR